MMQALLDAFFQPRSYLAARKLARGEQGGWWETFYATLVRSLLTLPGLLVVGVSWPRAMIGSFLGNLIVTATVIGYYLNAGVDSPDPTST